MASQKTILIAGGTGFIGQALVHTLLKQRYRVIIITRDIDNAQLLFPGEVIIISWGNSQVLSKLGELEAVINLAGENIGQGFWVKNKMLNILRSRLESVERLYVLLSQARIVPKVWIQASAIGYYGYKYFTKVDETDQQGAGFLAHVVNKMEIKTRRLSPANTRLAILRFGIVLDNSGGFIKQMQAPLKYKVVICPGRGHQMFSWISLDDLMALIVFTIERSACEGYINAVAPNPVTLNQLCRRIKQTGKAWFLIHIPDFIVEIIFGCRKARELILANQNVKSIYLNTLGFRFLHSQIDEIVL